MDAQYRFIMVRKLWKAVEDFDPATADETVGVPSDARMQVRGSHT
jgi:hypothetical protein